MQNKDNLEQVRAEFSKVLDKHIESGPELANAPLNEKLKQAVSVDSCFDFSFLNQCIMEGLRFQPPGGITPFTFD